MKVISFSSAASSDSSARGSGRGANRIRRPLGIELLRAVCREATLLRGVLPTLHDCDRAACACDDIVSSVLFPEDELDEFSELFEGVFGMNFVFVDDKGLEWIGGEG